MGILVRGAMLLSPFLFCNAFLDLTGPNELKGIWRGSTILPCAYVPVKDFVQQMLTWTVVHDQSAGTVFRRDDSGDHVLLSKYRDRVSVLKDAPGNVSLHILNLEVSDRGTYTCQVTWKASNNTLIAKEITTKVEVVKVAATKPIIRASELGLTFPAGARTSLTCVANGSPPISYRWFKSLPGGKALLLSSQAELAWDSLQPSDTGKYYCEAENRVGAGAVQQSDAVELTVRDIQRTHLSLYLIILIAVVCGAVVFLVIFLIICIRKPKDAQVYEVKCHNLRAAASSRCESVGHYEEPISTTENNYVMEYMINKRSEETSMEKNEYDCVGTTQESVYEVGDTNVFKNQGLGNLDFKMEREKMAAFVGDHVLEKIVNMYVQFIANVEKQMKIIKLQDCKREIVDFALDDETSLKVLGKSKCHQSDRNTQHVSERTGFARKRILDDKGQKKGKCYSFAFWSQQCGGLSQSAGKGERTCSSGKMGEVVWIVVFVMAFISCNALLDLSGVHEVKGTWMGSTTLPCTYMPSDDFTQQTLIWSMERDYSTSTIFRRDNAGDHILLSQFRDRVSVPKQSPGDASLLIENLEIPDSGHYTCQVIWRSKNNSLIKREVTTTVKVVKVAATKPIIRASELGLTFPAGARTSLTCVANGSPPISYRWFKSLPGGKAPLLSSQAELAWDSLQPSDTGKYYCEAENRVGAGAVQQSDAVELTVREPPVTQQPSPETGRNHRPQLTPRGDEPQQVPTGPPRAAPPPHLYALPAALGGAALGALLAAMLRRRRGKAEPLYEVAFHSTADVTRPETDVEVPAKCLHKETDSKTETSNDSFTMQDNGDDNICIRKNPEYENLVNAMESEY
ncbi:V-set and immunoglobulin domain-containing protein 4 [Morus bassanus]